MSEALDQLLNHQTQLDMDGIRVGVSRQAISVVADEMIGLWSEIARLRDENARLRAALTDAIEVLDEITGTHAPETLVSLWLDAQGAAARARAALGSAS